ncbi:MarR family transcriptional regulator [Cohnella endophytica]|uniref:MarR family transcriptional regulator n=1 Tax=Cohnella endophytica TaxID=2419778 RepID=A0A494XPF0_9BACL|nr:MarR family transcriptional regulator [Cohnella endophytica]RKP50009.1 MarR family transcriptional regulator [Cohnella endophytica]
MNEGFLANCLFFTANRLSRSVTKIAEEQFAATGLSPMYGYLILLVNGTPGITQKELAEALYVTPSTLTRFIDKLEAKRLVERKVHGKTVQVYSTDKGMELEDTIRQASKNLQSRYREILGEESKQSLNGEIKSASEKLEKK